MSLYFYKVLHVLGLVMAFTGLTTVIAHALTGQNKSENPVRGLAAGLHGAGMLIALIAGFGALAKLGLAFPAWAMVKIGLWLFIGAAIALPYRQRGFNRLLLILIPVVAAIGTYLAVYKPFY
jgi:hypothetical protein